MTGAGAGEGDAAAAAGAAGEALAPLGVGNYMLSFYNPLGIYIVNFHHPRPPPLPSFEIHSFSPTVAVRERGGVQGGLEDPPGKFVECITQKDEKRPFPSFIM